MSCYTFFSSEARKLFRMQRVPLLKRMHGEMVTAEEKEEILFCRLFFHRRKKETESENARYDGKCKKSKRKRNGGSIQTLIREVVGVREGGTGENNLGSDQYPYLARETRL